MSSAIARLLPRRQRARVEIIPLIDVIFFLLATFVLFTLSLDRILAVKVELPESGIEKSPDMLLLRVADADTLYFGDDLITRTELPVRLAECKRREGDPRIMIGSEPGVFFGAALAVYDEVCFAGIEKVTFDLSRHRSDKH